MTYSTSRSGRILSRLRRRHAAARCRRLWRLVIMRRPYPRRHSSRGRRQTICTPGTRLEDYRRILRVYTERKLAQVHGIALFTGHESVLIISLWIRRVQVRALEGQLIKSLSRRLLRGVGAFCWIEWGRLRGCSAPALQAGGQGFDSPPLHFSVSRLGRFLRGRAFLIAA